MSFQFSIEKETWEDLESDMPLRRINKIGTVVEVSAVTFPAYPDTEIEARNKLALDSARRELESKRGLLDSERNKRSLAVLKLKAIALKGDLK